jgi:hypothetical protein
MLKSIIYAVVSVILLITLIRFLFKKVEIQFQLMKYLWPTKYKGVSSYYKYMFGLSIFKEDILFIIWLYSPIYYPRIDMTKLENKGLEYHFKLVRNRRNIIIVFMTFIIWLFSVGAIIN